jgi:hypothetical protein
VAPELLYKGHMKLTLMFSLMMAYAASLPIYAQAGGRIVRESRTNFPRCLEATNGEKNTFFKWSNHTLTRSIKVSHSKSKCTEWSNRLADFFISWKKISESERAALPEELKQNLLQIESKTYALREENTAEEFLKNHPIDEYTKETNRELTGQYGNIFSAQVFKAWIESKPQNKNLRRDIIATMNLVKGQEDLNYKAIKNKVTLVVSFGLGWEESYSKITPFYIKDFLNDMKSLGLDVVFLKKKPYASVKSNIERIVPELSEVLGQGKDIIIVSLCKGTPEILGAEAEIMRHKKSEKMGRILGHVNLSGMLSGTFFADIASSVLIPKMFNPFMKIIPSAFAQDFSDMVSSLKFITQQTVEDIVHNAGDDLAQNIFYINVTGAPMSDRVLHNGSPMGVVVKYNLLMKFLQSANDGFIEQPTSLIPESISKNQATIVLDSTHLLADGYLDEFELKDQSTRRSLYYSILGEILKLYPEIQEERL